MKKEDWNLIFTGATAIIALVALFVAMQANDLNRLSNTAAISVDGLPPQQTIELDACYYSMKDDKYNLFLAIDGMIPFILNAGGAPTSLTDVQVESGGYTWTVRIFDAGEPLALPVEIPARTRPDRDWLLAAYTELEYHEPLETLSTKIDHGLDLPITNVNWHFHFGRTGTISKQQDYWISTYKLSGSSARLINAPCYKRIDEYLAEWSERSKSISSP